MENKEYYELSEEERIKQAFKDAKELEPKARFYLWDYCRSYGWRQMGSCDGYSTIEELKKDHTYIFDLKEKTPIKILKAE